MSLANTKLTASETTIFTCANANGTSGTLHLTNIHGSTTTTFTVHVRPAGEAADDENVVKYKDFTLAPGDSADLTGLLLANTDVVSAIAADTQIIAATFTYLDL